MPDPQSRRPRHPLFVGMKIYGDAKYDEGDTVESGDVIGICGTYFDVFEFDVWFAFALGGKTQKKVILAGEPSNSQNISDSITSDSQSTVMPSTSGGDPVSYVREKIIIAKSEGDNAQMVGFLIIAGSVVMFALMIIFGSFWIVSGMGSGLGGSGGTCDDTCESLGSAAKFSMWGSILLFSCGVIALARPWSWFSSDQEIQDPVVKVRIGILSAIALIAIISFIGPLCLL